MHRNKSFWVITSLVTLVAFLSLSSSHEKPNLRATIAKVASLYQQEMQRFDSALLVYPTYFYDSTFKVRFNKYQQLAYQSKKIECLFAYFHPEEAYETLLLLPQFQKRDFGPPIPDNWIFAGPFGLEPDSAVQKFSGKDSAFNKRLIVRSVTNFRQVLQESDYKKEIAAMTDAQVFDALRLHMVRLSTITLANGDMTIEEAGMPSFEGSFDSWSEIVSTLLEALPSSGGLKRSVTALLQKGREILASKPEYQQFNRMQFLTEVLLPLSNQLEQLRQALGVERVNSFAALQPSAISAYAVNAFNPDYFAPGEEAYLTAEKVELGKFLFFDPILSDNNQRACASCHKPELAFTDGSVKSLNFDRGDLLRNAPTVINSVFQKRQFWDLRATSLEDQLDSVVNNPDEMHSSFENVIDRINSSEEYRKLFFAAFPESKNTGIQRKHVKIAIGCYERVLVGLNSRFDQYVRGDHSAMTPQEVKGFNLYMGKAKCGTCHFAPLFNGALPPYYDYTDHHSLGVPLKDTMEVYKVDADTGASKPFQNPLFHFSFKTPTLRNIALTAPYMHNGVYKTLEQVVNFYDHGGGNKFTRDMRPGMKNLPFFMILGLPLNLEEEEKKDLVAFLKTLTDTTAVRNVPKYLPKLEKKYASLNKRKLGGVY